MILLLKMALGDKGWVKKSITIYMASRTAF